MLQIKLWKKINHGGIQTTDLLHDSRMSYKNQTASYNLKKIEYRFYHFFQVFQIEQK